MIMKDDLLVKEKIEYIWVVDVFFKCSEYFFIFLVINDLFFKIKNFVFKKV